MLPKDLKTESVFDGSVFNANLAMDAAAQKKESIFSETEVAGIVEEKERAEEAKIKAEEEKEEGLLFAAMLLVEKKLFDTVTEALEYIKKRAAK